MQYIRTSEPHFSRQFILPKTNLPPTDETHIELAHSVETDYRHHLSEPLKTESCQISWISLPNDGLNVSDLNNAIGLQLVSKKTSSYFIRQDGVLYTHDNQKIGNIYALRGNKIFLTADDDIQVSVNPLDVQLDLQKGVEFSYDVPPDAPADTSLVVNGITTPFHFIPSEELQPLPPGRYTPPELVFTLTSILNSTYIGTVFDVLYDAPTQRFQIRTTDANLQFNFILNDKSPYKLLGMHRGSHAGPAIISQHTPWGSLHHPFTKSDVRSWPNPISTTETSLPSYRSINLSARWSCTPISPYLPVYQNLPEISHLDITITDPTTGAPVRFSNPHCVAFQFF